MEKLTLLNENSNIVSSFSWNELNELYNNVEVYNEISKTNFPNFLKELSEHVLILTPIENGQDFLIKHINYPIFNFFENQDTKKYLYKPLTKMFPFLKDLTLINIIQEINQTEKPRNLKALYYKDEVLQGIFIINIVKSLNEIFGIIKRENSFDLTDYDKKDVFDLSDTAMVVIQDGYFVRVNEAYSKLSGYSIEYLTGQSFTFNQTFLDSEHNDDIYGIYLKLLNRELYVNDETVRIIHKEGHEIWFQSIGIPVNFEGRPAVQIICVDITEERNSEEQAKMLKINLDKIQDITKIAICSWDPINKYTWTSEIYNILEITEESLQMDEDILVKYTIPEDKLGYEEIIKKCLKNKTSNFNTLIRVLTGKNNLRYISIYLTFNFDEKNYSFVGFVQDVTEATMHSMKLNNTFKELENTLDEKDVLLKEVHHRVKNNLQIILSLLKLDSRFNEKNPQEIIDATINRINSMALIHEKIYGSTDLAHVNIKEYIEEETQYLIDMYNKENIELKFNLENIEVDMEKAIPIGLIINELVHNTIKYAFPNNEKGILNISLETNENYVNLIVKDNGIGISNEIDIYNSTTLGFIVINNLVSQIDGKFTKLNIPGSAFKIEFKKEGLIDNN
ncbi:MAG: PAS domain S-box protein [Methanobacteriaceae archaeon]|nr:PAS domain S-box protein [Methanobacteriaceae archaeon]